MLDDKLLTKQPLESDVDVLLPRYNRPWNTVLVILRAQTDFWYVMQFQRYHEQRLSHRSLVEVSNNCVYGADQ